MKKIRKIIIEDVTTVSTKEKNGFSVNWANLREGETFELIHDGEILRIKNKSKDRSHLTTFKKKDEANKEH